MKYWLEGEIGPEDSEFLCSECGREIVKEDHNCFVEFIMRIADEEKTDEFHLEPTGRIMCIKCGRASLLYNPW